MSVTLARLLEETMRPSLAAVFSAQQIPILCANEDNTPGQDRPCPSVVLAGRDLDTNYTVKHSGRFARNTELRASIRVDGTLSNSADTAEALAAKVDELISPRAADWLFFQPFPQDAERAWEGNTRVITLVWKIIALSAV